MPAELMLVADAPGFHDDRLGRPLVAAAGELLADLLASIGLERRDVYVTTLVKCRPPGTQSPAPEEVAACRDKLERQIELVRPRVVGALGDLATRFERSARRKTMGNWELYRDFYRSLCEMQPDALPHIFVETFAHNYEQAARDADDGDSQHNAA